MPAGWCGPARAGYAGPRAGIGGDDVSASSAVSRGNPRRVARAAAAPLRPHPGDRGRVRGPPHGDRSEEHTSELQSLAYLVCRLLLEKKKQSLDARANATKHSTEINDQHEYHLKQDPWFLAAANCSALQTPPEACPFRIMTRQRRHIRSA